MKKWIKDVAITEFIFVVVIFSGCKSKTVYVPIETIKKEYIDRLKRDSIFMQDSVFIDRFLKGDTVFLTKEKYKYIYKDRLKTDTISSTDTIRVPYPIKGDSIPYVTGWQNFQIWLGRIFMLIGLFFVVKRFLVKKFF